MHDKYDKGLIREQVIYRHDDCMQQKLISNHKQLRNSGFLAESYQCLCRLENLDSRPGGKGGSSRTHFSWHGRG